MGQAVNQWQCIPNIVELLHLLSLDDVDFPPSSLEEFHALEIGQGINSSKFSHARVGLDLSRLTGNCVAFKWLRYEIYVMS